MQEKSRIVRSGQAKYQNVQRCPQCLLPVSIMSDEYDKVKFLWCNTCKLPVDKPVSIPEGQEATR